MFDFRYKNTYLINVRYFLIIPFLLSKYQINNLTLKKVQIKTYIPELK